MGSKNKFFSSEDNFIIKHWINLKIGYKIGLGFTVLTLLAAGIGLIATLNMEKIEDETHVLTTESLPSVNETVRANADWREVMISIQAFDQTRDKHYLLIADENIEKFSRDFEALTHIISNSKTTNISIDKIDLIIKMLENYNLVLSDYKELVGKNEEHISVFDSNLKKLQKNVFHSPVVNNLNAAAFCIYGSINSNSPHKIAEAKPYLDSAKKQVYTLSGSSVSTASVTLDAAYNLVDGYIAARKVELKRSELEALLKVEVTRLASISVDQITEMTEKTNHIILDSQLFFTVIIFVFLGIAVILGWVISSRITSSIQSCLVVAKNISRGILHHQQEVKRKDELGELMLSLNRMNNKMKSIVEDITRSIELMGSASDSLNQNAHKLSDAATDQAASTEEISSSIIELHSTSLRNAENANKTAEIALLTASGVMDGKSATDLASASLKLIIERVGFIEDLAFETNILALNASIEAARAGEHGKGFVVVADEVRRLADSSKTAAESINEVSIETVTASDKAGVKLNDIIPKMEKTAQLIQSIKLASNEQEAGIDQINKALQQLNNIAQENAFSSENMANASEDLTNLASKLKNTINFFQIEN